MNVDSMKVLYIDDNISNLHKIKMLCKSMNLILTNVESATCALNLIQVEQFDIIIVDLIISKNEALEFVKKYRIMDDSTPIVMITDVDTDQSFKLDAIESGVSDFLLKPIHQSEFISRIRNLLSLKRANEMLTNKTSLLENEIEKAIRAVKERENETLITLGKLSEFKDPETNSHIQRVSHYSRLIAKVYGLSETFQNVVYKSASFHDIGKIGIPDRILLKAGKLTDSEWELMKTHSVIGYEVLKDSKSEYLNAGSIIALSHHEKFDGTGYPKGLVGDEIPLIGRIVSVADVFDALTSNRPYKKPWSFERTVEFLENQKGKHFDPKCVECFLSDLDNVREIFEKFKEYYDNENDYNEKELFI